MANPPFNQKDWRASDELTDDARWNGYDVPPASNANYGWILHMISKLSENGVAAFILANGALSGGGEEYRIRRKIIENDFVEAIITLPRDMFYTTDISVTLWIINKNKTEHPLSLNGLSKDYRSRKGEILFMDLRSWGSEFEKKYVELTTNDIQQVAENYHNWQQKGWEDEYKNIPEYCYSASYDEIKEKDFSLIPSKYIPFVDQDSQIDFDSEMQRIQREFSKILLEERDSQQELIDAFKGLGHAIEA